MGTTKKADLWIGHTDRRTHSRIRRLVAIAISLASSATALADPLDRRVTLDIPADTPLDAALVSFSKQSGVQIMFAANTVEFKSTAESVRGDLPARLALTTLLDQSGLGFTTTRSAVAVAPADTIRFAENTPEGGGSDPKSSQRGDLAVVVVTAQKRKESLLEVPAAVTAVAGGALLSSNQLRIQDYYTSVPGLALTAAGDNGPTLAIRGLTSGVGNPTVGVTIDDVPLTSATGYGSGDLAAELDPGDIARIEVLRGPQGTLYGANSIGGLLKYVTADPSTEEFSGSVQGGLSDVQNGDELGYNARASANVPVTDVLALRVSGFSRRDPGYVDNIQSGEAASNWVDVQGARLAALWRISSNVSLKLSGIYQDSEVNDGSNVQIGEGFDGLEHANLQGTGGTEQKFQIYGATLTADLGGAEFTSASGYSIREYSGLGDLSGIDFFREIAEDNFGVSGVLFQYASENTKFSQEFRLSIPAGQKLEWLLGAFYTHEESPNVQNVLAADAGTTQVVGSLASLPFPSKFEEYAAFADVTFHATDRFDIQVGGRASENRQTYQDAQHGILFGENVNPVRHSKESPFTYLVTPRYKLSADQMLYARFASGYRPGGPNTNIDPAVPLQYDADQTKNYEVGFKGEMFDAFSLDASLYYIDWDSIQLSVIKNGLGYYANGGKAKSQGVELAVETKAFSGFSVSAWVAYNEAELAEDLPPETLLYGVSGDRLPFSSRFSGFLAMNQQFPISNWGTGFVKASVSWVGNRKDIFTDSPDRLDLPSYTKADFLAGATHDTWSLNVFVNNLTDERGALQGDPRFASSVVYIRPRTIGMSLVKTF
jgi:iron complex outermembrane recepter protein